jgi:hypothetical protein
MGLKTDSSGLVIWDSKSSRWFLGLSLKTKRASVCQLRHKTGRGWLARDTRRDLAVCFAWKQVWLGFSVWPEDWCRSNDRWCTWHHRGDCVRGKLKTGESIRWAASDSTTLHLSFSMY